MVEGAGAPPRRTRPRASTPRSARALAAGGEGTPRDVARAAAERLGVPRREAYARALERVQD